MHLHINNISHANLLQFYTNTVATPTFSAHALKLIEKVVAGRSTMKMTILFAITN